jgi:hypothetical protein
MKRKLLAIAAIILAVGFSAFKSNNSSAPAATYYYNDGTWKVFTGTPCPEGTEVTCVKVVNGTNRIIYRSQNFGDPLKYNP